MKHCSWCNNDLSLDSFNKNKTKWDWLASYCRSCTKINRRQYYLSNESKMLKTIYATRKKNIDKKKRIILDYLNNKSCYYCWNNNILCLQFHHQWNKEFNISYWINKYSEERILKEINKCQVLCSNCHNIITSLEQWWWKISYLDNDFISKLKEKYLVPELIENPFLHLRGERPNH